MEIKKGYARGGHFHPFKSDHMLLHGKIRYQECEPTGNSPELVKIFEAMSVIHTPSNRAHLMLALEDSIFVEVFTGPYSAENYLPYRKIVEERMSSY